MRRSVIIALGCAVLLGVFTAAGEDEQAQRIEGFDKVLPEDSGEQPRETIPAQAVPPAPAHRSHDYWKDPDTRQLVETVMMVRLTDELGLDEEQTVVMVRRLRKLKDEMGDVRRARYEKLRALKESIRSHADDQEIQRRLDELLARDRDLQTFKQDKLAELSEGLSERQRAGLYVFLSEFEDDMRQLVRKAQERAKDWRQRDGEWRGSREDRKSNGPDNPPPPPPVPPAAPSGE